MSCSPATIERARAAARRPARRTRRARPELQALLVAKPRWSARPFLEGGALPDAAPRLAGRVSALHAGAPARPRRHGQRLAGAAQRRPFRRQVADQAAQPRAARARRRRAFPARGQRARAARASAHRAPARCRRRARRPAVPGARACRGRADRPLVRRPRARRRGARAAVPRRAAPRWRMRTANWSCTAT